MAPSTRLAGYRCSLPGLAGFAGVPSPGADPYVSQNAPEIQHDRDAPRGTTPRMGEAKESKSKLKVGASAPAFTLPDQDDKPAKLADYKGRWLVLYFYPNDDTPGCTTEACDFTNGFKDFEKLETTVVGCSPNKTESHRKFIAKYKLKVRLLSDPGHAVMEKYGAWGEKTMYGKKTVGTIRSTFLVGPNGKVQRAWYNVKADGHAAKVLEEVGND
jgi:thioredoxin-dependent peroxiredoxin